MRVVLFGGFVEYQIQLANALCSRASILLVLSKTRVPKEVLRTIDGRVSTITVGGMNSPYHPMNLLSLIKAMGAIRAFRPDVVHVQVAGSGAELASLLLLPKRNLITTFHDVNLHSGEESSWQDLVRGFARRMSKRIIVHGQSLVDQMVSDYGVSPEIVRSIPLGSPELAAFKLFERPEAKEVGNLVLFFGRIRDYKGLKYLVEAVPRVVARVPDAKFVIAGEGNDSADSVGIARSRKDNFILHNHHISYEEGANLFQTCSVVVLPYTDASQSGIVPVAYGFMRAVVVTNVGSIPEAVDHGKTGIIVPPKDVTALADAIVALLVNRDLRKDMGVNGLKKLEKDLSPERIADLTMDLYIGSIVDWRH